METPNWSNTFNSTLKPYSYINEALDVAFACGYPYLIWNGIIYSTTLVEAKYMSMLPFVVKDSIIVKMDKKLQSLHNITEAPDFINAYGEGVYRHFECEECRGSGEVHSHNPTCWECHGSGLKTVKV